VIVGPGCYVGPCASLRGDFGRIELHAGSNVQDNCVAHSFPDGAVIIEEDGHIGHGAILHGCRIGRNALVGMNAVVMDEAVIGPESIVAACAFVPAGKRFDARSLIVGAPAKVLRTLSDDDVARKKEGTAVCHLKLLGFGRIVTHHSAKLWLAGRLIACPQLAGSQVRIATALLAVNVRPEMGRAKKPFPSSTPGRHTASANTFHCGGGSSMSLPARCSNSVARS
jgi:carbonic anhydrase/acetyltransferase-like protein (isoleucine patch superfamily)